MDTIIVPGDQVRVPEPEPGAAAAVRRYNRERAFVLHPEDFHRLVALEELVAGAASLPPLEMSRAAVAAHEDETTPGGSITDPDTLKALLGG